MTPDAIKISYRRALDQVGEAVTVRRYIGTGASRTKSEVTVTGRLMEYDPAELVGGVEQGDRKLVLLAEDIAAGGITLPLTVDDRAVVRGKEMRIIAPDDSTRRVQGVLIAYELQVRG